MSPIVGKYCPSFAGGVEFFFLKMCTSGYGHLAKKCSFLSVLLYIVGLVELPQLCNLPFP